jgi:hypothetical protein
VTDPFQPAIVRVAQDARDRDDRIASAVLAVYDVIVRALDLADDEEAPPEPEPISALRHQLAATGRYESATRIRAEMDASHAAARRQSGVPPTTRRFDGSRLRDPGDERDQIIARQRLLANGQAARHAEMAAQPAPWDVGDAHPGTRAQRQAIYRRLQQEAGR